MLLNISSQDGGKAGESDSTGKKFHVSSVLENKGEGKKIIEIMPTLPDSFLILLQIKPNDVKCYFASRSGVRQLAVGLVFLFLFYFF